MDSLALSIKWALLCVCVLQFNPSRGEERRGRIFYDEGNERVATREEKRTGPPPGNTTNYWEIFLHKEVLVAKCEVHVQHLVLFTEFRELGIILMNRQRNARRLVSANLFL